MTSKLLTYDDRGAYCVELLTWGTSKTHFTVRWGSCKREALTAVEASRLYGEKVMRSLMMGKGVV